MFKLLASAFHRATSRPAAAPAPAEPRKSPSAELCRDADRPALVKLSIDQLPWPCPLRAQGIIL